ncbi:MAG: WYL domain-containing protein [Actinomycetota bacterium]|nr:WYL domain-containing protein [Actinomycetota bacterium]
MTSPRTAHRLARILSMLPWVIANPGSTVEEVCSRFGYSRRQLLEDLDLVFVCGLPGYGPGDLMVAYVEEDEVVVDMADYFSRPMRLTPAEALALLAAGMALISSGEAPPALRRAVDKLARVVVPEADTALAVELADEPGLVASLRKAKQEERVVRLTYTSLGKGETTVRLVEPWSVFSTLGNWYLSGYCRSARGERAFRVDRIRDVALTEERFRPPENLPPPDVRYTPEEGDVQAVIRLGEGARWVAEYYPVELLDADQDESLVRFSASDARVAARLLLRLGGDAELVEGAEVGEALGDLRERILARYGA